VLRSISYGTDSFDLRRASMAHPARAFPTSHLVHLSMLWYREMCEECSFDLRSASASQYSQLKPFGVIIDCVFVSVVFHALHSLVIAALWIWY